MYLSTICAGDKLLEIGAIVVTSVLNCLWDTPNTLTEFLWSNELENLKEGAIFLTEVLVLRERSDRAKSTTIRMVSLPKVTHSLLKYYEINPSTTLLPNKKLPLNKNCYFFSKFQRSSAILM